MSDITFMRGYGFPRGSKMDFAGYLVQNRHFRGSRPVPYMPEPSIFEKIPALDGGDFGSEMYLPTLDVDSGQWEPGYGPEYRPDLLAKQPMGTLQKVGLAAAGIGLLLLLTR